MSVPRFFESKFSLDLEFHEKFLCVLLNQEKHSMNFLIKTEDYCTMQR